MVTAIARILPRPVRPLTNEVLAQYLKRLACANGLPLQILKSTLSARGGTIRAGLINSAVLKERTLVFALPELREPADLDTYPQIRGRTAAHNIGPGCPACAQRRGITVPYPQIWSTHDNVICVQHSMWLNGTVFQPDQRNPVTKLAPGPREAILSAHQRHRRLLATHGRTHTHQAIRDAYEIFELWTRWRLPEPIKCRYREIDQNPDQLESGPTQLNAAMYPELVHLAELLSDPDHRRSLLDPDRDSTAEAFDHLIAVVLRGDRPYRAREPLHQWRRRQLASSDCYYCPLDDRVDETETTR